MNWPTENEWDEEIGIMRERRLTVLEIVLRAILDPLFTISIWFFSKIESGIVYVVESLTFTLQWLDRKYSMGEDKKDPHEYDPYAKNDTETTRLKKQAELTGRIRLLMDAHRGKKIYAILLSSERVLSLFDYQDLPDSIYGVPVKWVGATNTDFALEIEFSNGFTQAWPMDDDYSAPLLKAVEYRK